MVLVETILFEIGKKNILLQYPADMFATIYSIYFSPHYCFFRKRGKLRYFLWQNQFVYSNLFLSQKSEFDINLMEFIKTLRDFHLVSSNSYNNLKHCQVIWKEMTGWFILYLIQKYEHRITYQVNIHRYSWFLV